MQIEFQILDALQKIHTPVLDGMMCLITSLGNAGIIWILLTIALLINPKIRRTKDGTACRLFGESGRRSGCILLAALILDLILCNGILKNLFHRVRPYDIRTSIELLVKRPLDYSFPSGHTATAFMTATMLNKEYGHKSPWIGIGAYSVATATGLMRMANNKHWLSDVLTGAGIGILSTELGYYLADLIFKERGINRLANEEVFSRMDKPSFLSLYLGLNIPLSGYDIDEQTEFSTSSGSTAGVEGAYFFNPYIGAGGRFTVSNTSIIVNTDRAENNTFDVISFYGGSYFSYPFSSRWMIGSKLLGGYVHYPLLQLADRPVTARNGFSFGSGVSLTFKAKAHYGIRFFLDYDLLPSHSKNSGEYMNMLTLGSSFMIAL